MSEPLSVFELVLGASLPVKIVMGILVLASIVSWVFIIQRYFYFLRADRAFNVFEQEFWSGVDLSQLYRKGNAKQQDGKKFIGAETIFRAGFKEYSRLRGQSGMDSEAMFSGIQRAMRVASAREEDEMDKHLSFLATVGSISPYIGLFGTVWGIMTSFQGLAVMHQATLAAVAPGISEALVATAMGLFVAIPAVMAYNRFSTQLERLMSRYETFSDEFAAILHRQVYNLSK